MKGMVGIRRNRSGAQDLIEPLTSREWDVLFLLAKHLRYQDVAGELFLAVNSVKWYAQQIYGKLGVENRRDAIKRAQELGLLGTQVPSLQAVEAEQRHNLPRWLSSFIGREREVQEVQEILLTSRLVTLTGSGGSGKTRLSVQAAIAAFENYPNGIWFVELASILDAELIPQAAAAALGLQRSADGGYKSTLTAFLHDRHSLLIFDNCEHVLDACAQLIDSLLQSCPRVTVLATSRERLGITGEKTYRVPSLSVLDPAIVPDLAKLAQTDALRLFADRAAAVLPGFSLTQDSFLPAARICCLLDGIPLAIELAAARMSSLGIEDLADHLDDRFRLLTGGNRSALPRQRTLRASIDWSYSLLNEAERVLLQHLSVFAGGWTLAAAEAVCAGEGLKTGGVLNTLSSLVDKSLVGLDRLSNTQHRYSVLETIRQYASEKLEETGESATVRDQHLDYFFNLSREAGPLLKTEKVVECLERLDPELDNLRVCLGWALGKNNSDNAEKALGILSALDYFWAIRGLYWESFPRFSSALAQLSGEERPIVEMRAWGIYTFASLQTDFNIEVETVGHLKKCIALFRQVENSSGLALALALKSYLIFRQHSFFPPDPELPRKEAELDQEESYAIINSLVSMNGEDHRRIAAWVDCWNGAGEVFRPDLAKAQALGLKVQEYFRSVGDLVGEQYGLLIWLMTSHQSAGKDKVLGYIDRAVELAKRIDHRRYLSFFIEQQVAALYELENYEEMELKAQEGLKLQHQLGAPLGEVENYRHLGIACTHQGKCSLALFYLLEGLRVSTQTMGYKDPYNLLGVLAGFIGLAEKTRQYQRAAHLVGFIEAAFERLWSQPIPLGRLDQREFSYWKAYVREALSEADFQEFLQHGRAMSMQQAIALAQEGWGELSA